jgi:hypothetical protein
MGMEVDMQSIQLNNKCRTSETSTNIQMLRMELISNPSTSLDRLKVVFLEVSTAIPMATSSPTTRQVRTIRPTSRNKVQTPIIIDSLVVHNNKTNC